MQGTTFALAELACGISCSCLFVLPRLYRHLIHAPPYDSEEFKIRKWKSLAANKKVDLDDSQLHRIHRDEEQQNAWEGDIEMPEVPPKSMQPRSNLSGN